MKFKVLLGIFILAVSFGWAQGEWVVQDNPFNGNDSIIFTDVDAVDSLHCWVIGYNTGGGLWVLKTADGGGNWQAQLIPYFSMYASPKMLNWFGGPAIKFLDLLHGYFVFGWSVYRTDDGGETWNYVGSIENGNELIADIDFIDTLLGWAAESPYSPKRGGIYRTRDGGKTWALQDSSAVPGLGFQGVCFLDSIKGFVVGDSGTLLRTIDGGEYWTKIETGTTKDLMDIQFADSLHGIAVGDTVLRTIDGGENWIESGRTFGRDVAYPDSLHSWTTGFWFTTDGGESWQWRDPGNIPACAYYGVSFSDSLHGWIVGEWGTIVHYGPKIGIEEANNTKPLVNILQIYPNPFSKTTKISSENRAVSSEGGTIKIYDVAGKLVKSFSLVPRYSLLATTITWDGKNEFGAKVPTGIYFCQLEINGQTVGREKLVLVH